MAQSKKKLKLLVMNPLLQACLDRADAQLAQEAAGTAEGSVDIDMQLIGLAEEQAELNELEEQLRQLKDEQKAGRDVEADTGGTGRQRRDGYADGWSRRRPLRDLPEPGGCGHE
jgi:plasmid stabilization system protein ParE